MAELVPIPLPLLLRRAFLEYRQEGKIFDLPKNKFFRGIAGLDLSVDFHGHRVATPLGPAAGPHGQLIQNIALSWLAGARVIELKTVQILDELKIPRPCIDIANVGFNVEWSQELKLEQSLREYVGAAMFLEILKASRLAGDDLPGETAFDMSVGYNLEGIRSPRVRSWIASMLDARTIIDQLRASLTGPWARYRDLPFPTCVSDTISLSTFHGCPAGEIEGIVGFLVKEMGCHVCVKLNPTLLGYEEVCHLLHDVLGYHELEPHRPAFDNDLQFDEAFDLIPRLQSMARAHGRHLSVKFTNTLVVKNHKAFFSDGEMYMSGPPLHVLALNLVQKFRERVTVAMSFSGGLDANNMAHTLALGLVPVTTCSDLLRPGGFGRMIRYLENLGAKMKELGVATVPDFIALHAGKERAMVDEVTANPRYRQERNRAVPRKIGSKLWLYDCINCDKCVPVCPNDANFVYETDACEIPYDNFELMPDSIRRVAGGVFRVARSHQLANYADACNECGNCDVFCPEDGGPFVEKPRFFGSLETYRRDARRNGFYLGGTELRPVLHGTIAGLSYVLTLDREGGVAHFETADAEVDVRLTDNQPLSWKFKTTQARVPVPLDLLPYLQLKLLLESITNPRRVHFANVAALSEDTIAGTPSAV